MVWFQCEVCGDNLKKPKLANHFRVCSANRLSCIDCGQMFGQESVQGHMQCITETEKYGPKGQAKPSQGTPGKPNSSSKPKPEVDINVGLSQRPPWFCSLCNTGATSQQTLLLHADGKKHRVKARAFHASKQPPKESEEPTPKPGDARKNDQVNEEVKGSDTSEGKKRKLEASESNGASHTSGGNVAGELGNGEVIQDANGKSEKTKKAKCKKEDGEKRIKWKKMITAALKSNPDGTLKMRKLKAQVLKVLRESGSTRDENQLIETLEHKISSSSKFAVKGKYVQLVAN